MKLKTLTLSFLLGLAATSAFAEDRYLVRVPANVNLSTPETPAPEEATSIALRASVLPAGTVGVPYGESQAGFDLSTLLDVTPSSYSLNDISWSVVSGALPAGLEIQADGKLAGTPTVKNEAGASFEVQASYKGADGRQVYTIVVGGKVLKVTQIAAGAFHTCAVTTAGAVKCWGRDNNGQLGNDPSLTDQSTPVDVAGLTSGVASVSGGYDHTCAVTNAGALKCWGWDGYGQLGDDTALTNQPTPVDVAGLTSGVAIVSAGYRHTCAVSTAGALKCWGWDAYGQLGDGGSNTSQPTPVAVSGLGAGVGSVSAGWHHTCAVSTAGALKCWGRDNTGQLGNDTALTSQTTPVDVKGLAAGVASVSANGYHTCAVTLAGWLKCWGEDTSGQLGNDTALTNQPTPVDVLGLTSGVASVSAGSAHTCAITSPGGLKCWGYDGYGQLGDDTALTNQSTPVAVSGLGSGVATVTAGSGQTCAVTTAGALKCWGRDTYGQLGDGSSNSDKPTPVDVLP